MYRSITRLKSSITTVGKIWKKNNYNLYSVTEIKISTKM